MMSRTSLKNSDWLFSAVCLAMAFLFSFAVVLPHLLQRLEREYPFQGIETLLTDSEGHYTSRMREVADGFWKTGNVFFAEPKDQPYLQPPFPEIAIGVIGRFFGLRSSIGDTESGFSTDPVRALLLSKIYLPFLLFLFLVGFLTSVTHRPWITVLSASALLFTGSLLGSPSGVLWGLTNHFTGYPPLRFARPISPSWIAPWFFLALWLLASWMQRRSILKAVGIGLCTVIMLYSYYYAWTYIGATLAALLGYLIWKRDWLRCRDLLLIGVLFLILGIPYFLNLREAMHHPWYAETALRMGFFPDRELLWGWWLAFFSIAAVLSKRLWPWTWPLAPALAFGGWIVLDQQLLTGMYVMNHHYHWYFIHPLASTFLIMLLLSGVVRYIPLPFFLRSGAVALLLLLAVTFGIRQQAYAYVRTRDGWGNFQAATPVLKFLGERVSTRDVIYVSPSMMRTFITTYTPANLYTTADGSSLSPHERIRDTNFLQLWLSDLTPEAAAVRFPTDMRRSISGLFGVYARDLYGVDIPDAVVSEHIEAYRNYDALSLGEKLELYPLDYIILRPEDVLSKHMEELLSLSFLIYDEAGYKVYAFK